MSSGKAGFQLTLANKLLLTAAGPLVVVFFMLLLIVVLRHQDEVEAHQSDHSKAVISKTSSTIEAFNEVGFAFLVYDAATKSAFEEQYLKSVAKLRHRLHDLRSTIRNSPAHEEIVKRTCEETEEALSILAKRKVLLDKGGRLDLTEALELQDELNHIVRDLDSIISDEKSALTEAKARQRSGEWLKIAVFFAMAGAAIGITLVFVFYKGTARRLDVLIQNSERLGAGKPLAPTLEGSDELARLDQVFHEAATRLDETNKLRQQFVAMISHDMRTPLAAVKSTLELLSTGAWGDLSGKAKDKVLRAEDNLKHTINLINNLLDLEKMQEGKIELSPSVFDLGNLFNRCASVVAPLAESRSIELFVPNCDVPLYADEDKLTQVVINLLGNAVKFSPTESKVSILVSQENAFIRVAINDQGPGIPREERAKVFERYHQLPGKERTSGSGLGLAICKAIIEAHEGSIGVDPGPDGKGSSFWFRLPAD